MTAPGPCMCGCAWRLHALANRDGGCPNHQTCLIYRPMTPRVAGCLGEGDVATRGSIPAGQSAAGPTTGEERSDALGMSEAGPATGRAERTLRHATEAGPTLDPDNADTLRVLADLNGRRAQDPRCRQDADVYWRRAVACLAGAEAIEQTAKTGEPR